MVAAVYGLLGLLVGRALALVAHRLPSDPPLPFFKDLAACEYCGANLPRRTLVPLVGPFLAEPCAGCGQRISRRRLAIEAVTGIAFAAVAWRFAPQQAPVYACYAAVLILIATIDLEHRLIFDIIIFPAVLFLGPIGAWLTGISPAAMAAGAIIWSGFMLVSKWITRPLLGPGALGTGDIYLAIFLGTICGLKYVFTGMVAYALLSGAGSLLLMVTHLRRPKDAIPFAPFLILGAAIALWQQAP